MKQKKTKEELEALKQEVKALGEKLAVLSEEELEYVSGGVPFIGSSYKNIHDDSKNKRPGGKKTGEYGSLTIPINE